jgi:hypothetical protein
MGQTASKVAASWTSRSTAGASSTGVASRAAPSIASALPTVHGAPVVDDHTGFTRGTAPLLPSEEQQRQFLEARQGTRLDPVTGKPLPVPDQMPDDLLQFLHDLGPVQSKVLPRPQTQGHRPSRAPRGTPEATTNDETAISTVAAATAVSSTKPGHDPTRHVVAMPLAEHIPYYETQRTTSFSHTPEDTSESDPIGANAIQLFCLLSGKTSMAQHLASTSSEGAAEDPESPRRRMEQALQYIQTPVLLKDLEDGAYVGAWPQQVADLLQTHPSLIPLDTQTRAKLVLEDLWDREQWVANAMAAATAAAEARKK